MFELFITYVVGALAGGAVLVVWVGRGFWSHPVRRAAR